MRTNGDRPQMTAGQWWGHLLKFWPMVVVVGGALVGAYGLILEQKYQYQRISDRVDELQGNKTGEQTQWELIRKNADANNVQATELEYLKMNNDRLERRLERLERTGP